jgi:ubiquinone/menaquinone biosynthesis C-methylase UbiE
MPVGADVLGLYFLRPLSAYVRGSLAAALPAELVATPLDELTAAQQIALVEAAGRAGLRVHRFKRTMGLARVQRVIVALRAIAPADLLDVGTGRGAFLWPLVDAFPGLAVTCCERLEQRVKQLQACRVGGLTTLQSVRADATRLPVADRSVDVVTLLEVLEHIPDAPAALACAVRAAKRFVVLSVPSHADDNPEHVHLFDRLALQRMFLTAGAARVSFDQVHNHLIAVARVTA